MKLRTLLSLFAVAALTIVPALGSAQRQLHIDPDHFKVDKNKAKVKKRQVTVHPRRLAFNNKDGRHQIRVQKRSARHRTRKDVRKVTHHLTTPHHPKNP